MPRASVIVKAASYDYPALKPIVYETADKLCSGRIGKGSLVVIKPNLLAPSPPEMAILTHPLLVRAVAEYILDKGGRVRISDSNAMGSFDRVISESGFKEALKGLDVEFREFKESVFVDVGEPFRKIEIAKDALEADFLINLPKLKTHVQMLMTLGVKNLFGCIVGLRKPEWHLRAGVNRELFASLLVKIHKAVNPSLTIMDGILAMEGEGPGKSGSPRMLGVIMGSRDAFALDVTVCRMLGIEPDSVSTNKTAKEAGFVPDEIEVLGELPAIRDFALPAITPLVFGPMPMRGFMRRHLIQRPMALNSCKLCGECWKYCPAKAISKEKKKVRIDYEKCIRCYCCVEVCPHAALKTKEPVVGKVIRKIREAKRSFSSMHF